MLDLHDYSIIGIELECDRTMIRLTLVDPKGVRVSELQVRKVERLFVDGFSLQNVVLDAKMFVEPEDSFEYRRACELLDLELSDKMLLNNSRALLFIEASVGAEVACLVGERPHLRIVPR